MPSFLRRPNFRVRGNLGILKSQLSGQLFVLIQLLISKLIAKEAVESGVVLVKAIIYSIFRIFIIQSEYQ